MAKSEKSSKDIVVLVLLTVCLGGLSVTSAGLGVKALVVSLLYKLFG